MGGDTVKRFLSGVSCPRCGEMDTVRIFEVGGNLWRDCVACGMEECFKSAAEGVDLDGKPEFDDSEISVVRFVPAVKNKHAPNDD